MVGRTITSRSSRPHINYFGGDMASSPVIPGTTTTTAAPMYLFFDTETNAIGRLCKPVTQTLMQLAWIVTDEQGSTIASNNRFVQGATSVGPRAPHPITPEYVNKNGCPPQDVLRDFMTDVDRVLQSGGRLVAHNIAFDVGVLEHAGAEFTDAMHDACLCTMKHANIVAHCSLKNVRGGVKQPKLVEMYTTLFDHAPTEKLHDAMADTKVLSLCFHELLRLGVLRPQPEAPRQSGGGGGGGGEDSCEDEMDEELLDEEENEIDGGDEFDDECGGDEDDDEEEDGGDEDPDEDDEDEKEGGRGIDIE